MRPDIARLGPDWVPFVAGTRVPAGIVIYCTGYRMTSPVLRAGLDLRSGRPHRAVPGVFPPEHPSLAFVGLLQPLGAIMPPAEAQGELLADHDPRGEYLLLLPLLPPPPRHAMEADIGRENEQMRRRYVATKRHTIQVDFDRYLFERERRRGAQRALLAGFELRVAVRAAPAGSVAGV